MTSFFVRRENTMKKHLRRILPLLAVLLLLTFCPILITIVPDLIYGA